MRLGSFFGIAKSVCLNVFLLSGLLVFGFAGQSMARTVADTDSTQISSDSTQRLQNAVHRLNAWLHISGQGQRWRQELMLNVLETQSAIGEKADIGLLNQIHSRFSGGASELQLPVFQDVRTALQMQVQHLDASHVGDLFAAVTTARGQFRQITSQDMAYQRDLAKQSLLQLKDYWRETIPSRERALLFDELQLDQAIAFLDTVKFDLAPENSVGKMSSRIRGVEAKLDEVGRAIDALPFETESKEDDKSDPEKPADGDDKPQDSEKTDQEPKQDDGEPTRDELEKKRAKLQAQIDELKKQRSEINKLDRPRQNERRDAFVQLRKFEDGISELRDRQGDPYIVSAGMTFSQFVRVFSWGTSDNLKELYLKRLDSLESDLLQIDGPDQRVFAGKVGDHLRWMENTYQVPHLVTAIRAQYSLPNIFVSVSGRLLNQMADQSVNESQCVNERIDGRLVRGTLYTTANVSIDLQDDPNQVHASIHLTGNMNADTYIDQGKLRVFASTSGQLEGRRSIYANVGGLYAGIPKVAAKVQAFFKGTSSPLRLVNRIATKKFGEVKRKTEGSAARKAEDKLLKKFGAQTDEALAEGQKELHEAYGKAIPKTNLLPEIYLRSFRSEIMAIGNKSSISSLGAQTKPAGHAISADVVFRLHDSLPSNYFDKIFSGKTFSNEDLAQELGSIVGEAPVTLTDKPNASKDESFSITFASIRPIQIEFEDNLFRVIVSGRSFAQGDKKINEGLKIILRFKIAQVDGKLKLVRDGEAEIDYLDNDKKRPATIAFRSFLIGKLNPKDGGEELSADLPDNLLPIDEVEQLQDSEVAKGMKLMQCRCENGWLYLGWKYRNPNDQSNLLLDIPAIWNEKDIKPSQPLKIEDPAKTP